MNAFAFFLFVSLLACSSGPKRLYIKEKNLIRANKLLPMGHQQDWETHRPVYHQVTKFVDVEAADYTKRMQREARRNGNDLCIYELENYELSQPCGGDGFVKGVAPRGPYPGVVHGDFDGDGLADSYGIYHDPYHRKNKRMIELVWFGGDPQPRAVRDMQVFYSQNHIRYDEKQLELTFVQRFKKKTGPEHDRVAEKVKRSPWVELTDEELKTCFYVLPPRVERFGRINTFTLNRAVLGAAECGTFNQTMYVFSKDRLKIMLAPARGE